LPNACRVQAARHNDRAPLSALPMVACNGGWAGDPRRICEISTTALASRMFSFGTRTCESAGACARAARGSWAPNNTCIGPHDLAPGVSFGTGFADAACWRCVRIGLHLHVMILQTGIAEAGNGIFSSRRDHPFIALELCRGSRCSWRREEATLGSVCVGRADSPASSGFSQLSPLRLVPHGRNFHVACIRAEHSWFEARGDLSRARLRYRVIESLQGFAGFGISRKKVHKPLHWPSPWPSQTPRVGLP